MIEPSGTSDRKKRAGMGEQQGRHKCRRGWESCNPRKGWGMESNWGEEKVGETGLSKTEDYSKMISKVWVGPFVGEAGVSVLIRGVGLGFSLTAGLNCPNWILIGDRAGDIRLMGRNGSERGLEGKIKRSPSSRQISKSG